MVLRAWLAAGWRFERAKWWLGGRRLERGGWRLRDDLVDGVPQKQVRKTPDLRFLHLLVRHPAFGFLDKVRIEQEHVVKEADFRAAIARETFLVATHAAGPLQLVAAHGVEQDAPIVVDIEFQLGAGGVEAEFACRRLSEQ